MKSYLLQNENNLQQMRTLITQLPQPTVVDFEETMLLPTVRANTRLWQVNEELAGFAFVDDYNNLRFEIAPKFHVKQLEDEIIAWGVTCVQNRNAETGTHDTLDAAFSRNNSWQIALLERTGFVQANQRTLSYARSSNKPIVPHPFPSGFQLRAANGASEVEKLVALHRATFGTDNMTVAQRLAIMQAPDYEPELDLVAVTASGELAAFCICSIEAGKDGEKVGYTDPIGTHPRYQQQGLGKAIVTAGLQFLQARGTAVAKLGTSSTNMPMQRLAEALGFICVSEKLWFSKRSSENMTSNRIQQIEAYAEKMLTGPFVVEAFRIAHDLPHVRRVYANAMRLAQAERYPHLDRVAAAALLHDVGLPVVDKRGAHPQVGAELAARFLQEHELFAPDEITEICEAIVHHGRLDGDTPLIHILRDADTFELLGTVGVMRAFTSKAHKPVCLPEHPRGETWGLTAAEFTQRFQAGLGMGPTILDQLNFQLSCYENLSTKTAKEWGRPLRDTLRQFIIQFAEEASRYPE